MVCCGISAKLWTHENTKLNVAISVNEHMQHDEHLLPCAKQETEKVCQEVTDNN